VAEYLDNRTDLTTKIQNWINDVRKDIALKYNFDYLYTETTVTTSQSTATYNLPTDYLGHEVIKLNDKKLSRFTRREFDLVEGIDDDVSTANSYLFTESTTEEGTPDYYIDKGMQFDLYPVPDGEYTITIKYYSQPVDFDEGTDEDYISRFHFEAIIFGAALRGAMFLDDKEKQSAYGPMYMSALQEMIRREKEKRGEDIHVRWKTWKDYDLDHFRRIMKFDNS
jgi:hypothetical protein